MACCTDSLDLCIAPLRGVTVVSYREVYARHFGGIDRAVAPFVPTVKGSKVKPSVLRELDPVRNAGMPVIPQLLTKDPDETRVMLRALSDLGYDRVDLNLGCPYPMVRKRGRGAGLMANEPLLRELLDAACEALPGGISVKVRLGIENATLLEQRAELFNAFPLAEVTIHPRTALQMYEGTVDLDAFARVLPMIRHRVVYNGDLYTVEDVRRLLERFPALTHLMLGRGLVADPFLPECIRGGEVSPEDRSQRLLLFLDDLLARYESELYGPAPVLGRIKELWGYLYVQFTDGEKLLRQVQRARTIPEYRRLTARLG